MRGANGKESRVPDTLFAPLIPKKKEVGTTLLPAAAEPTSIAKLRPRRGAWIDLHHAVHGLWLSASAVVHDDDARSRRQHGGADEATAAQVRQRIVGAHQGVADRGGLDRDVLDRGEEVAPVPPGQVGHRNDAALAPQQ